MSFQQGSFVAVAIPGIVAIFNYLWIKRRGAGSKSDPGDTSQNFSTDRMDKSSTIDITGNRSSSTSNSSSQFRPFSRSLSGVESAPIDIIIPAKLRASKSNAVVISDEDLDQEIEKANSMRYGNSIDFTKKSNNSGEVPSDKKNMSPPIVVPPVVEETVQNEENITIDSQENITDPKEIIIDPTENVSDPTENIVDSTKNIDPKENITIDPKANIVSNEVQNQNNERDSANHSPADVMMVSSSICSNSDNLSERSSDSGKGGSNATVSPVPKDLTIETPSIIIYEFLIPQTLVGKLIGKYGSSVRSLKAKTGAHVIIRKHPDGKSKYKVCMIEGTNQQEIDHALEIIREKFPTKRFPEVTLEQVIFAPEIPIVIPETLKLIAGIDNDTKICCVVHPNHLFLHQYIHPTFRDLEVLNQIIDFNYNNNNEETPYLPTPIEVGTICIAYADMGWYRAAVEEVYDNSGTCKIKFLDYGGYATVDYTQLRQIRHDFLTLSFQATEVVLANIETTEENGFWAEGAYKRVCDLVGKHKFAITHVVDYKGNITHVNCYLVLEPGNVVFLNEDLVKLGYARWTNDEAQKSGASRE